MKTESLERLMDKYREGTLSDEERDELNRLTHRDAVMAAASQRARGIQHAPIRTKNAPMRHQL